MNEIKVPTNPGKSLYAVIFDAATESLLWNGTTFVGPSSGAWPTFAIPLSDPDNIGFYVANFPTAITIPGNYSVVIYQKIGSTPDVATDPSISAGEIEWNGISATDLPTIPVVSYSTVENASDYFESKLYTEAWTDASTNDQQKALNESTMIINNVPYIGIKTSPTQQNEWPRDRIYVNRIKLDPNVVPSDIIIAHYEIAFAILKGISVETELRSLRITSRGLSSVRTTYDSTQIPEWLMARIPSATAWAYLSPYVNKHSHKEICLHRV